MAHPRVALITGLPGTGKTTVGRELSDRLSWPFITKDAFKEAIFDTLGWSDKAWSLKVSAAAHRIIDQVLDEQLRCGQSVIVESNFKPDLDSDRFQRLTQPHSARIVQILCWAQGEVLFERYAARLLRDRHPGHAETDLGTAQEDLASGRCPPLTLPGALIEVDTTDFDAVDYASLVAAMTSDASE